MFDLEQFRQLLEFAPDAMLVTDRAGAIAIVNTLANELFAYRQAELVGKPFELLAPQELGGSRHQLEDLECRERRTFPSACLEESTGVRKDGTKFPVEISRGSLPAEEGEFVIYAIRDLSKRQQYQPVSGEKNAELERALTIKARFLGDMSHELRTPLNAIIGFTGTLLMELPGPLNDDQKEQLQTVERSANHLLGLINSLLRSR